MESFVASLPCPPRRLVLDFDATEDPVRVSDGFPYVAKSWCGRERRMIVKAEHAAWSANPRYFAQP